MYRGTLNECFCDVCFFEIFGEMQVKALFFKGRFQGTPVSAPTGYAFVLSSGHVQIVVKTLRIDTI